jgi:DNA-binding transcriptional LysR family regulator
MLNLHEIEVFLAAAENSNFSDAARHLHLSQPAVSQTIQGLEKRLNVNLFERKGRRVELSDAGQALVPMARDLLASAQRVEDQMGLLQGVVAGQIALGCSTGVGKYLCLNSSRISTTVIHRYVLMSPSVHAIQCLIC